MAFQTRFACGFSRSHVSYVSKTEVAWVCGNSLILLDVDTQKQRVLSTTGYGIHCFAASSEHGVIAIAEKGGDQHVSIHGTSELKQLTRFTVGVEAAITAVSLSADGELLAVCSHKPESSLTVWNWHQGQQLASAALDQPASQVSFHPADPAKLCTTSATSVLLWGLQKLWSKHELSMKAYALADMQPTCHAWAPEGVYVGCSNGSTVCIDTISLQVISATKHVEPSAEGSPAVTSMSVNKYGVLIGSCQPVLRWFSRGAEGQSMQLLAEAAFGTGGAISVEYGGTDHQTAVIGTADGSILKLQADSSDLSNVQIEPLADCHVGAVTGLAHHPDGQHMLSCGADGSVRVWHTTDGSLVGKRDFGASLTCMVAASCKHLVAVGSETGVVRIVAAADIKQPPVLFRARVHSAPVLYMAFNPSNNLLVTASINQTVCFLQVRGSEYVKVLGYAAVPEPITGLCWPPITDGEDNVLISLQPGAIMSIVAPIQPASSSDLMYSSHEVPSRIIATEAPLLHITAVKGDKFGVVYGLAADKLIHKILLPADNAAWAGVKGRAVRTASKVPCHKKVGTCITACPSGQLLLSGGSDGSVMVKYSNLSSSDSMLRSAVDGSHDTATYHVSDAGSVAAVAFDACGRWMATAGRDGSLFLHATIGSSHISEAPVVPDNLLTTEDVEDQEAPDDMSMPTYTQQVAAAHAAAAESAGAAVRGEAAQQLTVLKERLLACLTSNAAADEADRIDEKELIVDQDSLKEYKRQIAAEVAQIQQSIQQDNLCNEVVTERIKVMCWTAMQEKCNLLSGMKSGAEVWNFPLPKEDEKSYNKVAMLRLIEMTEAAALQIPSGDKVYRTDLDEDGQPTSARIPSEPAVTSPAVVTSTAPEDADVDISMSGRASMAGNATITPAAAANDAPAVEMPAATCEPQDLLYSDLDVTCPGRKKTQIVLYRKIIRNIKMKFNEDFAKLKKQKHTEADRIADLTTRMDEIGRELSRLNAGAAAAGPGAAGAEAADTSSRLVPHWSPLEDLEDALFKLHDNEIKAERYSSAEEVAKQRAEAAATEERRRRGAADDAFDRALKHMMGGSLVRATDEVADLAAARPAWMNGNPQEFNEEQLKQYKEYQAKERTAIEERLKRKVVMDTELRTIKASAEDIAAKFDEALAGLAQKRLTVLAEIVALEARVLRLACDVEAVLAASDDVERAALKDISSHKEKRAQIVQDLQETRSLLEAQQEQLQAISADEKQMDRNFKREFADADGYYSKLAALYKQRLCAYNNIPTAAAAHASSTATSQATSLTGGTEDAHLFRAAKPTQALPAGAGGGAGLMGLIGPLGPAAMEINYLDPDSHPEGIDLGLWERFLEFRAARARLELTALEQTAKVCYLKRQLELLEKQDAQVLRAVDDAVAKVARIKEDRKRALYDVELRLKLKQGQVETTPVGLQLDLGDAVLVGRTMVEGLNGVVRAKGAQKLDILTAIKDFKRGIYQLEWEHKKCEMQAEDIISLTKELQLLHVTKDFQQLVKAGPEGRAGAGNKEVASLEALLKTRDTLHVKRVDDKKRKLRRIADDIRGKAQQNSQVQLHLDGLEKVLDEQARLQGAAQATDDASDRRMRALVTHRKLRDIANAQQSELEVLRAELQRLQRKTFPTFVNADASLLAYGPDDRIPASSTPHA